jgi:predicted Zn-dependent peptidase
MADDFARATGAPVSLVLAGKEYLVYKLRPRDLGELEAWLKSVTPDPRLEVVKLIKDVPEEVGKHMWDTACAEARENWPPRFDTADGERLLSTPEGEARIVFQILKRGLPGLTLEQARDLAEALSAEDVAALTRAAGPGDPGDPKSPARCDA